MHGDTGRTIGQNKIQQPGGSCEGTWNPATHKLAGTVND